MGSFIAEMWAFLRTRKKFWLVPLIVMMVVFGSLMLLAPPAVLPFIYTVF